MEEVIFPPLSFFFFSSLSLFWMIAPRDDGEEVELEAFVFQMKNPGASRTAG